MIIWPVLASGPRWGKAQLDDKVARKVFRLDFTAFFSPESEEGSFIVAHDDPGVRAADEVSAFPRISCADPILIDELDAGLLRGSADGRRDS